MQYKSLLQPLHIDIMPNWQVQILFYNISFPWNVLDAEN